MLRTSYDKNLIDFKLKIFVEKSVCLSECELRILEDRILEITNFLSPMFVHEGLQCAKSPHY